MCRRRKTGFSTLELMVAMSMFGMFSLLMFYALQGTSKVWQRTSARDRVLRELVRARAQLTRDLMNSSAAPGQFATGKVGPSLGAGFDGDALTVLNCDDGNGKWTLDANGNAVMQRQVTYALWVPNNVNAKYGFAFSGVADADNYEEACPYKWLVRKVSPAPGGSPPAIPATWLTALTRPSNFASSEVVATLLGFRVRSSGAQWELELKATAVDDARRKLPIGSARLGASPYTLIHRFTVGANNG